MVSSLQCITASGQTANSASVITVLSEFTFTHNTKSAQRVQTKPLRPRRRLFLVVIVSNPNLFPELGIVLRLCRNKGNGLSGLRLYQVSFSPPAPASVGGSDGQHSMP